MGEVSIRIQSRFLPKMTGDRRNKQFKGHSSQQYTCGWKSKHLNDEANYVNPYQPGSNGSLNGIMQVSWKFHLLVCEMENKENNCESTSTKLAFLQSNCILL